MSLETLTESIREFCMVIINSDVGKEVIKLDREATSALYHFSSESGYASPWEFMDRNRDAFALFGLKVAATIEYNGFITYNKKPVALTYP